MIGVSRVMIGGFYLGFSTIAGLSFGVPIIIWIVKRFFESNQNVGGVSALILGLVLAINIILTVTWITKGISWTQNFR